MTFIYDTPELRKAVFRGRLPVEERFIHYELAGARPGEMLEGRHAMRNPNYWWDKGHQFRLNDGPPHVLAARMGWYPKVKLKKMNYSSSPSRSLLHAAMPVEWHDVDTDTPQM